MNPEFLERVQLIRAFVGSHGRLPAEAARTHPDYSGVEWIGENELIRWAAPGRSPCGNATWRPASSDEAARTDPNYSDADWIRAGELIRSARAAGHVSTFASGIEASAFTIRPVLHAPDRRAHRAGHSHHQTTLIHI
jgi:hypothetical protein